MKGPLAYKESIAITLTASLGFDNRAVDLLGRLSRLHELSRLLDRLMSWLR